MGEYHTSRVSVSSLLMNMALEQGRERWTHLPDVRFPLLVGVGASCTFAVHSSVSEMNFCCRERKKALIYFLFATFLCDYFVK